eukprot:scaffold1594_cov401-Prasinococcus_capsulatus_cf.AAC.30
MQRREDDMRQQTAQAVLRAEKAVKETEWQKGEVSRLKQRVVEYEKEVFALERQLEELNGAFDSGMVTAKRQIARYEGILEEYGIPLRTVDREALERERGGRPRLVYPCDEYGR